MRPALPRLHLVTNDRVLALPDLRTRAQAAARAGQVALHVRGAASGGRRLTEIGTAFHRTGALVFVNDRADVARAIGAAGVHLPADGLPVAAVRRLVGPLLWVGCSTHSPDEARAATEEAADYVFLGPIWETVSHPGHPPLGPDAIAAAHPARVIAIGGITPARAATCRRAGAYGVAVISAVWDADDPGSVAREMVVSLQGIEGIDDDG